VRAQKLSTAGLATVAAVASLKAAAVETFAKKHGLPKTSLARWRAEARGLCGWDDST
jgi:hypothetical protein